MSPRNRANLAVAAIGATLALFGGVLVWRALGVLPHLASALANNP